MNKKIFENARFCPKGDIEANWNKAVGFIPLDKEIIIYKPDASHPAARFKVGDGKTVVQELPFSGTDIEAIEKLIDEKGELLIEYVDNAVAAIDFPEVDQAYNAESENAQSGKAVANVISPIIDKNNEQDDKIAELEGRITTVTFNITEASTFINFHNGLPGMTKIDWGDGHINSELTHTYEYKESGTGICEYTCKIYDLKQVAFSYIGPPVENGFNRDIIYKCAIGNSVTTIDNMAFQGCHNLTHIEIGNSVTYIGEYAFQYCSNLTEIVIPDNVTRIGGYAFAYCFNLTSAVIGNGVTSINNSAFRDCSKLTSITLKNPVPIYSGSYYYLFYNCAVLTHIYVPYGCAQAYREKWSADGASQDILDKIVESDREAMMSDLDNIINLQNGIGAGSIQQKGYETTDSSNTFGAIASGEGAVAFGGQRYDKIGKSTEEEPQTEAKGIQSFAQGGGVVVEGAWSVGFGKDNRTYQKAAFAIGGGNQVGLSYEEWLAKQGLENTDENLTTYQKQYSFAFAGGETSKALGRDSFAFGYTTEARGDRSTAFGYATEANSPQQFVIGQYNKNDSNNLFEIGYGSNANEENRRNIFEVNKFGGALGRSVVVTEKENSIYKEKVEYSTEMRPDRGLVQTISEYSTLKENSFRDTPDFTTELNIRADGIYQTILNRGNPIPSANIGLTYPDKSGTIATREFVNGKFEPLEEALDDRIKDGIGADSASIGTGNNVKAARAFASGGWNTIESTGAYATALGLSNIVAGPGSHALGSQNNISNVANAVALGSNLKIGTENQIAIGKYNKNQTNTLFEVGNGTSDTDRKNAFEILSDGKAKVYGDLVVTRNLEVAGTTTTKDTETVMIKDNTIVANSDGVELIEPGGFAIKTNETSAYGIMYDPNGDGVKIGLGSLNKDGKFNYAENEAQFLATRADEILDGNLVQWDDTKKTLVDTGKNIAALEINLENGIGTGSIQQKSYKSITNEDIIGAIASEEGAVAFGGQRYDKVGTDKPQTEAKGKQSFAAGGSVVVEGDWSAGFNKDTKTYQKAAFACGGGTQAGNQEEDPSEYSFAFASGECTKATGRAAHAQGTGTHAFGLSSHAEGDGTYASGRASHAQGLNTRAFGNQSHAGGDAAFAYGDRSFAHGSLVQANINDQFVIGKYNDNKNNTLFEIGNGVQVRSNAFEVYQDGRAKSYVDITKTTLEDNDLVTVAYMKQYIKDNFATLMAEYLAVEGNKPTTTDISSVFEEEEA